MLAISVCPRCQRLVSLPGDVDATWPVCCPYCGEQFPLGEAIPPELVPVDGEPDASDAEETVQDDGPVEVFELEDHIGVVPSPSEEVDVAFEEQADVVDEPDELDVYSTASFADAEPENEAVAVAAASQVLAGSTRLRRQKTKPWWRTFLAVVSSAVIGLLVGYYVIAWWFGPQFVAQGWPIFHFLPGIQRLTAPAKPPVGAREKAAAQNSPRSKPADVEPKPVAPEPTEKSVQEPAKELGQELTKETVQEPIEEPTQEPVQEPVAEPAKSAPSEPIASPPVASPPAAIAPPQEKTLRPQPGTAEYLGPRLPPSVNADQLGQAIDAAEILVSTGKADATMSAEAYDACCRLGEALAFANGPDADVDLADRIVAGGKLLEELAERPSTFNALGPMAAERVYARHRQNEGVLLAGSVKTVVRQGHLWGIAVELAGAGKTVGVVTDQELQVGVGDQVAVLGVVVRDPAANLVGYTGTKPVVVWNAVMAKRPSP